MGVDFIDIPYLHRKKLISLPEINHESTKVTKDGYFDLSPNLMNNSNNSLSNPVSEPHVFENTTSQVPTQTNEQTVAVGNFFNDFAALGAANSQRIEVEEQTSQTGDSETVRDLKWRIENLEYKLEQLTEKLNCLNQSSQQ